MHAYFLRHCLTLANRGRGKTGINPMVGAVLVREGVIIAEGFHEGFGKVHAELHLLQNFEQKIRSTDTLYVNLEPCCHTKKKTPPCAQLLIERGIKRVVYGMLDPNPAVAGKGIDLLNKNSIQTFGPVLEQECKRLNRGFVSVMTKKRPWITLKSAMTADGKFAKTDRSRLKITSSEQDRWSHQFLRGRHDAILVGVGTVIADDPQLTMRIPPSPSRPASAGPGGGAEDGGLGYLQQPLRIILDPFLRTPQASRIVRRGTIIVAGDGVSKDIIREFTVAGIRIIQLPKEGKLFAWNELWKIMTTPDTDFHGISSILVEGGPKTWELFRRSQMVDEEVVLVGNSLGF